MIRWTEYSWFSLLAWFAEYIFTELIDRTKIQHHHKLAAYSTSAIIPSNEPTNEIMIADPLILLLFAQNHLCDMQRQVRNHSISIYNLEQSPWRRNSKRPLAHLSPSKTTTSSPYSEKVHPQLSQDRSGQCVWRRIKIAASTAVPKSWKKYSSSNRSRSITSTTSIGYWVRLATPSS